ncbi:hypothetical protein ES708_18140 [subsurface metagenome]
MMTVVEYIRCSACGEQVEIQYDWITGHYEGECPSCRKWFSGSK